MHLRASLWHPLVAQRLYVLGSPSGHNGIHKYLQHVLHNRPADGPSEVYLILGVCISAQTRDAEKEMRQKFAIVCKDLCGTSIMFP